MAQRQITFSDIASLDFLAEDALHEMRFSGFHYDEHGKWIPLEENSLEDRMNEYRQNREENILEFAKCSAIRALSLTELANMPLAEIQKRYLSEVLHKACGVMRTIAYCSICAELSLEITDDYLRDLFSIRWRDNAMMWIARWEGAARATTENLCK